MRWLTVRVPGEPGREILLELPGAALDGRGLRAADARARQQGRHGLRRRLHDADCQKTYETLRERGVEFTQEPTKQFYGIDCGVRDPFGNHLRIVELTGPIEAPDPAELLSS